MCYMLEIPRETRASNRVGVRELRQNLSVYLARVQRGDVLDVTDRGQIVAMLVPVPNGSSALDRLVASGRATAARGDLVELSAPPGKPSPRFSRLLAKMRDEERY
jgi:prevent-host-death family protein